MTLCQVCYYLFFIFVVAVCPIQFRRHLLLLFIAITILFPFLSHSQVPGLKYGSEDFEITTTGMAFVTSGFAYQPVSHEFKDFLKKHDLRGRIYSVDLNTPKTKAVEIPFKPSNIFDPLTFRPHGISVLEDKSGQGQHLLYVISHPDGEADRIEKFRYLPVERMLRHEMSIFCPEMHITNDLAVLDESNLFISDYLYYNSQLMHMVESLVALKLGGIIHYNGSHCRTAAGALNGPNGILLSRDKKYVVRYIYNGGQLQKLLRQSKLLAN